MPVLTELARESAVALACNGWETLVVTGPDRRSWLEGLVTCQVGPLAPGQGAWGLSLNRQGKIQSVVWIVAAADALWLALAPGTLESTELELSRRLIMEDAELARPHDAHAWFSLHGPEAERRAGALASALGGHAAAIDWTGLGGAALVVPNERAQDVLRACADRLLTAPDWTRLRLERGLPEFGRDFDGRDRPHEAALERRAVNWSKGCYLGQEVVCMQDMRGKVKRSVRLFHVAAPADAPLGAGAALLESAAAIDAPGATPRAIGELSSAAYSERAQGWVALARVDLAALGAAAAGLRCVAEGTPGWPARSAEPV
jgi:folate-binding protein YgfZ